MNTQDVASELSQPGAQELLTSATVARLAYSGKDGFPRVIPIGFYWNGEAVVVATAPVSPKVAAMSAQPQVALTIDTQTSPPTSLLIRGVAAIETVEGIPSDFIKASTKGMDQAQIQGYEAQARATYKQMSRITITPNWARFYDFGAGRVPGFLLTLMNVESRTPRTRHASTTSGPAGYPGLLLTHITRSTTSCRSTARSAWQAESAARRRQSRTPRTGHASTTSGPARYPASCSRT